MTVLRRLPPRLEAALSGARARVEALDPLGRQLLALGSLVAVVVVIGAVLALTGAPASDAPDRAAERNSFLTRLMPSPGQYDDPTAAATERLARKLSVEEKVDQLGMFGFEGTSVDDLDTAFARGEVGGLAVAEENYESKEQLEQLIEDVQGRARRSDGVRPLFMVSQEGGDLSALADVPPAYAPADTASVEEAAEDARNSAEELKAIGMNGVLGPVLDVGSSEGGPLGVRPFSDDANEVARFARAVVPSYVEQGLLAAPLHFPGLGGAATSTEEGPAQVGLTVDQLRRRDLRPFRAAIEAGAQGIVVGHGLYGTDDFAVPASASRFILTDLLRRELGFEGLAITDDLAAGAITASNTSADAAVASIVAGADMVRLSGPPEEQERMREELLAAVRDGRISRERLDDAVIRVLEAKRAAGRLPEIERELRRGAARRNAQARERAQARRSAAQARARAEAVSMPGVDRREGRSPGPGGVKQKPPRRRSSRQSSSNSPQSAPQTRTYTVPGTSSQPGTMVP